MPIINTALTLLKSREFVALATASPDGKPNCAPKLLLKVDGRTAYFIDYGIGRSFDNIKANPEVSLSVLDADSLMAYRLNGKVEIVDGGPAYEECLKEFTARQIELSAQRIVKGVQDGKRHAGYEVDITEKFLVYIVTIDEGCEISPRGAVKRESD
jgi:uncharacterized pyridoxamine 5'-phosphate oxidase family protein